MKRSQTIIAFLLLLTSCSNDSQAIRQMCEDIHSRYPLATLQDVYKTCYQDYFGAEHLMSDTASARRYLQTELEECRHTDMNMMPKKEPTGFRHRFTRVSLSCVAEGELSEKQLLALFLEATSKENTFGDDWEKEWTRIAHIALQVCPTWTDPTLQSELQIAAQNKQAVSHSKAFREAYHPHYRIVKTTRNASR